MKKIVLLLFCFLALLPNGFASASEVSANNIEEEKPFDQLEMLMEHVSDTHSFPIFGYKDASGIHHEIKIPLPVILYNNGNFHFFSSSRFAHENENLFLSKGSYFKLAHNKIYETKENGELIFDEAKHITNNRPLDISITRNVATMWISIVIIFAIFISIARSYKKTISAPRGIQSFFEPLILFVRDDIAYTQIGKKQAARFLPFLLTLFFFIWINNLLGLVPFFPGGANLSGNIAFAMVLAVSAFIITNINGSKTYWKHIFTAPGIPLVVKFILVPVEFSGILTKPFALMIRLFANITAGHLLILSLVSMIFLFKSIFVAPPSVLIVVAMMALELFVGILQAYIFTLLTAMFVGMAIHEEEHH